MSSKQHHLRTLCSALEVLRAARQKFGSGRMLHNCRTGLTNFPRYLQPPPNAHRIDIASQSPSFPRRAVISAGARLAAPRAEHQTAPNGVQRTAFTQSVRPLISPVKTRRRAQRFHAAALRLHDGARLAALTLIHRETRGGVVVLRVLSFVIRRLVPVVVFSQQCHELKNGALLPGTV